MKNIALIQKEYSLEKVICQNIYSSEGVLLDGYVSMIVERPFLLLDTVVIDTQSNIDSDSQLTQGFSNELTYLQSHPIVPILQVASVRSFHTPAGRFQINDLRPDVSGRYVQMCFILKCNDFV